MRVGMPFSRFPALSRRAVLTGLVAAGLASLPAAAGDGVDVFPDPSRLVAVGGSITEIVFALGKQNLLIARDSTSVYPQEAFKLPDVGYMRALSPEGVLSVKPSAILALHGSGPSEAVDVLKKASVPFIEVPDGFGHKGILEKIAVVGKAIGAEAEAATLAAAVDKDLSEAEALTSAITERKRVLFILSFLDGKIMGSGADTAADGIIALAGGANAVEGFSGYRQLSDEAVITAQPDLILMMDRGGDHAASADELFSHPAIASTPAGGAKRLVKMDGAYLLGFGPRTANAVRDLASALYGETLKQ
ncbi:MAG: ABC transporter substrate-binding protein [Rhizobiaceae bacterium]|nr:ABC transporter substrate-binding protein [Rhizobiaceae bacterium]